MSIAIVYSRANVGIDAPLVRVEVHLQNGLPTFSMVGLPETVVKESKDRVKCALISNHFEFPAKRITVNLSPADLPKEGGRFDLPIAIGILVASRQLNIDDLSDYEFAGELALTGELHRFRGALPFAIQSKQAKRKLILPKENADEAALSKGEIYAAEHLLNVYAHLNNKTLLPKITAHQPPEHSTSLDISDIKGQTHAKRALTIAASGKHNMLFIGPPGTGKTMLANRITTLMPSLTEQEALEVASLASISHKGFDEKLWKQRPFRSPHHSASSPALIGGSNPPKPGEISLAHHGLLFLDELPEFSRHVLEALREPLESGTVSISRASRQAEFPAKFQLIAAMNPCPCGYAGDTQHNCRCTLEQIQRYQQKISGPLLDRIDMHIEVPRVPFNTLHDNTTPNTKSSDIKKRVLQAQAIQYDRQQCLNNVLSHEALQAHCTLDTALRTFFNDACETLGLSLRAYHRILKVARTIADLANEKYIQKAHLSEAILYRKLDRKN